MEHPYAMARLLQGDVGTGKTVVALLAAMHLILSSSPRPSPPGEGDFHDNALGNIFQLAQDMWKHATPTEEIVWEILRNRSIHGLKFRRQHPFSTYIADFYCHEAKIVIEIDGKIHENQKEYDTNRDTEMQQK